MTREAVFFFRRRQRRSSSPEFGRNAPDEQSPLTWTECGSAELMGSLMRFGSLLEHPKKLESGLLQAVQ